MSAITLANVYSLFEGKTGIKWDPEIGINPTYLARSEVWKQAYHKVEAIITAQERITGKTHVPTGQDLTTELGKEASNLFDAFVEWAQKEAQWPDIV